MKSIKSYMNAIFIYTVNIFYTVLFTLKASSKKKNILIYTDSRGFLVNCLFCKKTPYQSYIAKLSSEYNIDYQLCPHTHTTLIDFLQYMDKKDINQYETIILHLGIVDFSPRPMSQFDTVYQKKVKIAQKLIPQVEMVPHYYKENYEGEKTFSLYTYDYLEQLLIQLSILSKETTILWLGINKVDVNWNGNYLKQRPSNINIILKYQAYIEEYIASHHTNITYINIDKVENFNLKLHTLDNMHLSKEGFSFFHTLLQKRLDR